MKKFQILIKKVRSEGKDLTQDDLENGNFVKRENDKEVTLVIEVSTLDKTLQTQNRPQSIENSESSERAEEAFSISETPATILDAGVLEEGEQKENFERDGDLNGILHITKNVAVEVHHHHPTHVIDKNENVIKTDDFGNPIVSDQEENSGEESEIDNAEVEKPEETVSQMNVGKYRKLATIELHESKNYSSEILSLVSSVTSSGSAINIGENVNPEGFNLKILLRKEIPREFCDNKCNEDTGTNFVKIEKFPFELQKGIHESFSEKPELGDLKNFDFGTSNFCYLTYNIEALEDINWDDFAVTDEVIINYEAETFDVARVSSNLTMTDGEEEETDDPNPTRAKEINVAIDNAIDVEKEWKTSTGERKNYEIETSLINIQILDVVEICSKMKVELPLNRRDDLKFDREHNLLKDSDIMEEDGETVPNDLLKKLCTYKIKIIFRHLIQERLLAMNYSKENLAALMENWQSSYFDSRGFYFRLTPSELKLTTDEDEFEGRALHHRKSLEFPLLENPKNLNEQFRVVAYQIEKMAEILDYGLCSLIESSIFMISSLPRFFFKGTMDALTRTSVDIVFIEEWMEAIRLVAGELLDDTKFEKGPYTETLNMIQREHKHVIHQSKKLKRFSKKSLQKTVNLLKKGRDLETNLNTTQFTGRRFFMREMSVATLQRDFNLPRYISAGNDISTGDVYGDHLFFSLGKLGVLISKSIEGPWAKFCDLTFSEKKVIFLGMVRHLKWTLAGVFTTLIQLQEIHIKGYPASVSDRIEKIIDLYNTMRKENMTAMMKGHLVLVMEKLFDASLRFAFNFSEIHLMMRSIRSVVKETKFDPTVKHQFRIGGANVFFPIHLAVPRSFIKMENNS